MCTKTTQNSTVTMAVVIRVDTREPALLGLLRDYCEGEGGSGCGGAHGNGLSVVSEPLDIGDVHICFGGAGSTVIIERKTCADLAASIKDGRYKEQKLRLLASGSPPQHIIYVLEGVPRQEALLASSSFVNGVRPSVISGMMIHTMLRDGIHVVAVKDTRETAAWVWTIAQKCLSNPEKVAARTVCTATNADGGVEENHYLRHIKIKKMDNITPSSCYVVQLCQIPGISVTTAGEIAARYPTMLGLLTALSGMEDEADRIRMLSEIPMIGRKKAQLLLSYLLP